MPEPDSTPRVDDPAGQDDGPVLRSTRLPAASTSALRSSLDDQEARTNELREALHALRDTLEGRAAQTPPPAPRPARPRIGLRRVGLVAALVVVLAAAGTLVRAVTSGRQEAGGEPFSSSSTLTPSPLTSVSTPAASPSPGSPSPSPPQTTPAPAPTLSTRPLPWPGGAVLTPPGLTAAGPGVTVPGLDLTAALDRDGSHVDLYERIVLRPGISSFVLSQAGLGRLPRTLRGARPSVQDLQVELDGQAVRPVGTATGWRVAAPDGADIGQAVLRYRLAGAFVGLAPAPPGRVTLLLRPLGAAVVLAAHDAAVVRISDVHVGALTCPTSRHPLCSATSGRTHTATIPADATGIVLAQVNRR